MKELRKRNSVQNMNMQAFVLCWCNCWAGCMDPRSSKAIGKTYFTQDSKGNSNFVTFAGISNSAEINRRGY